MGLLLYSMYICISACIDWLLCILIDCIFSGANHCCKSELPKVQIILISYINFSNKVDKMANSYHKSKLSTYKQSPSSNLVSYTSMDYKSLPSSNSNSHMDHQKCHYKDFIHIIYTMLFHTIFLYTGLWQGRGAGKRCRALARAQKK